MTSRFHSSIGFYFVKTEMHSNRFGVKSMVLEPEVFLSLLVRECFPP